MLSQSSGCCASLRTWAEISRTQVKTRHSGKYLQPQFWGKRGQRQACPWSSLASQSRQWEGQWENEPQKTKANRNEDIWHQSLPFTCVHSAFTHIHTQVTYETHLPKHTHTLKTSKHTCSHMHTHTENTDMFTQAHTHTNTYTHTRNTSYTHTHSHMHTPKHACIHKTLIHIHTYSWKQWVRKKSILCCYKSHTHTHVFTCALIYTYANEKWVSGDEDLPSMHKALVSVPIIEKTGREGWRKKKRKSILPGNQEMILKVIPVCRKEIQRGTDKPRCGQVQTEAV